jgi:hypothetical protein
MAMALLAHNDSRVQEEFRRRDFALLYDMMVKLQEELRTDGRRVLPEVQPLDESLTLQVGLAQNFNFLRGCGAEYNV